jgi:hypothetical protein
MSRKIKQEYLEVDSDLEAEAINLQNFRSFACQISMSNGDTFLSTVSLEVSNDQQQWVLITGTDTSLNGTSDVQLYDTISSSVGYARVKIVPTSGSADIKIDYVLK